MAFSRGKKNKNFTVLSNDILQSMELSLKAKGLLCQILSYPDDWKFSVNGLAQVTKDSHRSIRTAILELEDKGYLRRRRIRCKTNQFTGMEYDIMEIPLPSAASLSSDRRKRAAAILAAPVPKEPQAETPQVEKPLVDTPQVEKPQVEKPQMETPSVEVPFAENAGQINTYLKNTYLKNTKEKSKKPPASVKRKETAQLLGVNGNVSLTQAELDQLRERFPADWVERIDQLSSYLAHTGKDYKSHYRVILKWAEGDRKQRPPAGRAIPEYTFREGESY